MRSFVKSLTALCPVRALTLTPRFNAVANGRAERKTVSNGFSPGSPSPTRLKPGVNRHVLYKATAFLFIAILVVLTGCNEPAEPLSTGTSANPAPAKKQLTVAFLPKSKGNAYFVPCAKGAQRAADELGDKLIVDGPTDPDPARQNEIVENWITLGVDVIAASCENKEGISTALRKAEAKGIKVITYDADALPDARSFFVNQATPEGIGYALMDEAARLCESNGEFAVITGSLTAENQVEWCKFVEKRRAAAYPNMKCDAVEPCDDLKDKAQSETTALLATYPNLKLILSTTSLGVPGAAEAIKQAGKTGVVKNIGLGLPNENKRYVHEGVTQSVILWKTEDLGYLTVYAADALARGTLKPGDKTFKAGSLGEFQIEGDNIMLGKPFTFNKDNIDQFDF